MLTTFKVFFIEPLGQFQPCPGVKKFDINEIISHTCFLREDNSDIVKIGRQLLFSPRTTRQNVQSIIV